MKAECSGTLLVMREDIYPTCPTCLAPSRPPCQYVSALPGHHSTVAAGLPLCAPLLSDALPCCMQATHLRLAGLQLQLLYPFLLLPICYLSRCCCRCCRHLALILSELEVQPLQPVCACFLVFVLNIIIQCAQQLCAAPACCSISAVLRGLLRPQHTMSVAEPWE